MLAVIGVLLVVWLACVLVGVFVKGLFWLIALGAILFIATAFLGFVRRQALSRGQH